MTEVTASVADGLWDAWAADRSKANRDRLILHYSPLVKFVAGRVAGGLPNSVEQADLASYGLFGLIDAIERFEPERGYKFETYAMSRIRGNMMDELRAIDWVPRSVRSHTRQIEAAYATLEAKLGRPPTDAEVAEHIDLTPEQLRAALAKISRQGVLALDETVGGDRDGSTTLADTVPAAERGPGDLFEDRELRGHLREAIAGLPERERMVLSLYYFESLTLARIGEVLGVSESRVSQIHTKALLHVRGRMQAAGSAPD